MEILVLLLQQSDNNLHILVPAGILFTIISSGFTSYIGVRVALAEIKIVQRNHDEDIKELKNDITNLRNEMNSKINRLEAKYFS